MSTVKCNDWSQNTSNCRTITIRGTPQPRSTWVRSHQQLRTFSRPRTRCCVSFWNNVARLKITYQVCNKTVCHNHYRKSNCHSIYYHPLQRLPHVPEDQRQFQNSYARNWMLHIWSRWGSWAKGRMICSRWPANKNYHPILGMSHLASGMTRKRRWRRISRCLRKKLWCLLGLSLPQANKHLCQVLALCSKYRTSFHKRSFLSSTSGVKSSLRNWTNCKVSSKHRT